MKKFTQRAFIAALTAASLTTSALASGDAKDWHYGDGYEAEHWSHENKDYATCDVGKMQSPIDLGQVNAKGHIAVGTNYGHTHGKLKLAPHKIQVDFPAGMTMVSGDKTFNLLQVHFHTPAEHAINGTRHPLVAHFVHSTASGELGVLGVMFTEGEANSGLQSIVDAMHLGNGAEIDINATAMTPADLRVYRYMGSLTTPPCTEGVNWHVTVATVSASSAQIAAFGAVLQQSARSLQPLNNRLVVGPAH